MQWLLLALPSPGIGEQTASLSKDCRLQARSATLRSRGSGLSFFWSRMTALGPERFVRLAWVHCFGEAVVAYSTSQGRRMLWALAEVAGTVSFHQFINSKSQRLPGIDGVHAITCTPGTQQCSMQITLHHSRGDGACIALEK